ncbi:MAG TPA: hypothetical protein VIQ22_08795, partial [Gammaproteobacteria bacterium]
MTGDAALIPPEREQELMKVLALSDFVGQALQRAPELLAELFASGDLDREYQATHYRKALAGRLEGCSNEQQLGEGLR